MCSSDLVQVIPHVTDEIKSAFRKVAEGVDVPADVERVEKILRERGKN